MSGESSLKNPPAHWRVLVDQKWSDRSAEADLGQDALAGQQFGAEADDETEHGQAAIPGLSEVDETETGLGGVGHEEEPIGWKQCNKGWRFVACAFGDTAE